MSKYDNVHQEARVRSHAHTHTRMHEATSPETVGVCDVCVAIEKVNNRVIPKAECHT